MNLNQVTVPSVNLEVSIPFYEQLGLILIVKALPHYARFECPDGSATFSLQQVSERPTGDGIHVYFEYENLDETVTELARKGMSFDELPTDKPWLWREARLKDPDNNVIILYYAGNNRKNPPWRIIP